MKKTLILAIMLSANLLQAVAQDNRERHDSQSIMKRLDQDKDGKLSRVEFKADVEERFDKLDKNKDGFLDLEELKDLKRPHNPDPERILKDLDANGDGSLSKEEARGPLKDHFDRADKDADGKLSLEEIKANVANRKPKN